MSAGQCVCTVALLYLCPSTHYYQQHSRRCSSALTLTHLSAPWNAVTSLQRDAARAEQSADRDQGVQMDRPHPKEDTTYPPVPSTTLLHILDPLTQFGLFNIQHQHLAKDLRTYYTIKTISEVCQNSWLLKVESLVERHCLCSKKSYIIGN